MLVLGKKDHIDDILALVFKFFGKTQYGHLPVDKETTRELVRSFVEGDDPDKVCLLWEVNGVQKGILAGHITVLPFLSRKIAIECLWWVDPDERRTEAGKKLLDAFEHWASLRGADMVQMMSMPDKTGKLLSRYYRSRGYRLTEITYTKEL